VRIEITRHCWERMHAYSVTAEQVMDALERPDRVLEGHSGRRIAQKRLNSLVLRVVFEERQETRRVITVYKAKRERYEV
jgi:hypothetical protein